MTLHGHDHAELGRQLGICLRGMSRLHARIRGDAGEQAERCGPGLERAAYLLLGWIVGEGPTRMSALAAAMNADLSTVSRQVATLEAAGLLARQADPADRRSWLISATPAGREVLASTKQRWHGVLQDMLADWTPGELQEFVRQLTRFNDALRVEVSEYALAPTTTAVASAVRVSAARDTSRVVGEPTEGNS